jgi:RNA polymerase-binding transcription factor
VPASVSSEEEAVVDDRRARELVSGERTRVEAALRELLGEVHSDGLLERQQTGESDSGSQLATEMVETALIAELRDELAAVERAEERIAAGTFGLSIDSGLPIPEARLDAAPLSERTVEEQRLRDTGDAG